MNIDETMALFQLTVERGDHIVPSFQEISGKSKNLDGNETGVIKRQETAIKCFVTAMNYPLLNQFSTTTLFAPGVGT